MDGLQKRLRALTLVGLAARLDEIRAESWLPRVIAMFPNATCVVPLVDRLVHHSEIIDIDGDSYRLKEARERGRPNKA